MGGQLDDLAYHNVIVRAIGTRREACMASPKDGSLCVLKENTSVPVFSPGLVLHRVISYEFEQPLAGQDGSVTAGRSGPKGRCHLT